MTCIVTDRKSFYIFFIISMTRSMALCATSILYTASLVSVHVLAPYVINTGHIGRRGEPSSILECERVYGHSVS